MRKRNNILLSNKEITASSAIKHDGEKLLLSNMTRNKNDTENQS